MIEEKDVGRSPASQGRAATPSGPSPSVSGIAGIPNAGALLLLAERVEAVTGPDRELDAVVGVAMGAKGTPCGPIRPTGPVPPGTIRDPRLPRNAFSFPRYTSSLDAAMSLVPEMGLAGFKALWDGETKQAYRGSVDLYEWSDGLFWRQNFLSLAATPALALTAACLRARAASGIVAATAGETACGLDERSEQSPVGEAETPKNEVPNASD